MNKLLASVLRAPLLIFSRKWWNKLRVKPSSLCPCNTPFDRALINPPPKKTLHLSFPALILLVLSYSALYTCFLQFGCGLRLTVLYYNQVKIRLDIHHRKHGKLTKSALAPTIKQDDWSLWKGVPSSIFRTRFSFHYTGPYCVHTSNMICQPVHQTSWQISTIWDEFKD